MSRAGDQSTRGDVEETASHIESLDSASTSASRRARLQIQLKRLEAEQELSKKKAALEIEAEFTRKKYEALEASIVNDSVSVRSKISKGRSDQLVRDWMANLKSIPVGEINQEATNVHEDIEGAVGGVVEKTSSEKDQGKVHAPCLAARSPANEDCFKRGDRLSSRQSCPMPVSNEVENLRQMLDQYKALYFAEKEKNRQKPSVLQLEHSKGACPKQLESSKPTDDCHLSSTPKYEQQGKELPAMQYKLAYSAIDSLGQAEHMAVRSTNDHLRKDVCQSSVNMSRRHESSPTDGHTAVEAISAAPAVDGLEGNTHFRGAATVQAPNAVAPVVVYGPTPQQLAARQILPRDLPCFDGNPADWPVFISQYNYTTQACGYSDGENMIRLQRCLKGAAWDATRSRLILPASVPHVIEALRMRYGRSELLIESLIERVRNTPCPKADKLDTIIEFGTKIQTLCDHITAANLVEHLGNPMLLKDLIEKLPAEYKMRWAAYRKSRPIVNLQTFGEYMEEVVTDACSVSSYRAESDKSMKHEKAKSHDRSLLHSDIGGSNKAIETNSYNRLVNTNSNNECLVCRKVGHRVRDCDAFEAMSTNERWKKVQSLGLCRTCLFNHGRRPCRINNRCGVNDCQTRHHPLLHSNANDASALAVSAPLDLHFHSGDLPSLLFRIIPVNLYNGSKKVSTYAFLDEGSNISMIERKLAAMLGATGYRRPLCLKWTGNVTKEEEESHRITLEISGAHQEAAKYTISEVGTVDSLDLPRQSLPIENLAGRFRHLQGLPIQSYCNVTPQLLIGVDNLKLAIPLKVREGREGGPTAAKTRLGWCVYGGHREESQLSMNYHVCECSEGELLNKTLKAYFSLEEVGIQSATNEISQDDERALRILEQTTKRVGDRYESGLLWRYDEFEFPDSYAMAVKRLQCLERKLAKDPALNDNIRKQIHEYELKGYAHRASPEELTDADLRRVWYLPLGAVSNPRKPGKVRLIWDASAKVDGISLNSMLLKGPDQLTLLPAVLFRFRQYPVAVSADIKEMFHQVRIRPEDRHAQRFVYRSNPASPPETYLMNVATFGSSCSPATAQFVKNTNANMFAREYPRAVQGIVHNHYVDDYLDSFASTEEAIQIASQVKMIHQYGGFEIRNWCSNQRVVLEKLGKGNEQTVIELDSGTDKQSDRVLGLSWDTEADEFRFNTSLLSDISLLRETNTKPTKRQLARCVMSFFDPQGFLAPYLVFGKVLLQDTWREGTGWDEQIGDGTFERWQNWLDILDNINNVRIPRCYFSKGDLSTLEIHTFVDASEIAYSCVTYFRITNSYGSAEVAFVASKTKVAPLKPTTIPRLELMACVLGVRLAMFAVDGHSLAVKKYFFWTDAEVAMSWIYADHRKYRPFVAFRVGEILEKSNRDDWRWVSSKLNPADEATKWGVGPHFNKNSIWYEGPEFLRYPAHQWPQQKRTGIVSDEIRACYAHRQLQIPEQLIEVDRFSSWKKLLRAMAHVIRFVNNCRISLAGQKRNIGHLTQFELQKAEEYLFRAVQWECYVDELATLTNNQKLPYSNRQELERTSPLYKLSPILDSSGVLRLDSRISAAQHAPIEMKHPIILPKRHRLTMLVLEDLHRRLLHANNESVVNEARQRFYIPQLRTQVRQMAMQCQVCKIRRAQPAVPRMAPLPTARLASYIRPFTYCGLDYFGPVLVKVNRSHVKRWVAIFTCLTIRAVHVEVVHKLDIESCIKGVRRFMCRRGSAAEIYSDNATCFRGAERLLREQINKRLAAKFTSTQTKWKFIPPSTPHMGGAWERMVRSVKVALSSLQDGSEKLNDESLQTFLAEAEAVVNCRPLTYLPLDSVEQEALTPNHFLLGSSSGVRLPVVQTTNEVSLLKGSWTTIQKHLDIFWKRWVREYLPTLTKRTKWFGETKPIQPGDLVLIIDDTQRNGWVRGRVLEVLPAADGRVRQAVVQTAGKAPSRKSVSKLAVLEISKDPGTQDITRFHRGEDVAKLATAPGRKLNQVERNDEETWTDENMERNRKQ